MDEADAGKGKMLFRLSSTFFWKSKRKAGGAPFHRRVRNLSKILRKVSFFGYELSEGCLFMFVLFVFLPRLTVVKTRGPSKVLRVLALFLGRREDGPSACRRRVRGVLRLW